jgi:hypothetical protein
MTRRLVPITAAALVMLLVFSFTQAQELRAAPPREPDVLRAAPDPGTVAQESRDIGGRWLSASDAAVQEFGKAGGTLTNVVTGKVSGLSTAIAATDWASPVGALSAGDIRGAVSGAVAIKTGAVATAGAATLFGEIGAATGGVVGSFLPVIGNIAGTMVGGAIGTAAGGFIAAYGYDKYVKDYVIKRVTGLVSVFDTAPLDQAMQARRAFLLQTMSPEQQAQLQSFSPQEVQLIDFAALPYVPVLKQPAPQTPEPDAQQQAALPPDDFSTLASFQLNQNDQVSYPLVCNANDGRVSCFGKHSQGPGMTLTITLNGTRAGNVLEMENFTVFEATSGCTSRAEYRGHDTITLEKGGRANIRGSLTARQTLRDKSCKGPDTWGGDYQAKGSWRAN